MNPDDLIDRLCSLDDENFVKAAAALIQEGGRRGRAVMPNIKHEAQTLDSVMYEEFVAWLEDSTESEE